MRFCCFLIGSLLIAGTAPAAEASDARDSRRFVVEAIGTGRASPDVFHVLMKMECPAGLAADAAVNGEAKLEEFLSAVDALGIPDLSHRVVNNVMIQPNQGYGMPGVNYVRNVVFTLPNLPAAERESVVAKLEDVGARHNSHCVTCIGSG